MHRLLSLLVFLVTFAGIASAQDTLSTGLEVVAHFSEAQALKIDPEGLLYVATVTEVVQLGQDGRIHGSLDGTSAGSFGEVSDVDPGNGLIWVIADAENGHLLRFTKELLHLESIRVPRSVNVELERSPRLDLYDGLKTALGRPISIAVGSTGAMFVIDASSQQVLKWDSSRRLERRIGEFGAGAGELVEPISLSTDTSLLYVADRALGLVKVYDYFGGHVRNLKATQEVNSVTVAGPEVWVILPQSIWIYDNQGAFLRQVVVDLDSPLLAAIPVSEYILLLTSTRLLRARIG
ncbi:MAG: hypothetical protein OXL40_09885 [Bacteroidota bacterium]|nr:hypothetical protein [Bacteroidota bacterium]